MTLTEKYKFKILIDQFGKGISENYADELATEELFEYICLNLKSLNKSSYSMIELGSNQAFYSLLFKHILEKEKTLNIMVEPLVENMERGKVNFNINNCRGVWYNNGIGSEVMVYDTLKSLSTPIKVIDILQNNSIEKLDILHCDIDGAEFKMLTENYNLFLNGQIGCLFLSLHSELLTKQCREFFIDLKYEKIWDWPLTRKFKRPVFSWDFSKNIPIFNLIDGDNNGDGWLVYRSL